MTKTSACRARAAAKLRDPEALNLLARPRFDPASASLHRRLLSLLLVVLVALYAAYEIGRGSSESESFTLSTTAVYERGHGFERTTHSDYIARNYGFEIARAIENIWKTVLPDEQSSWTFLDPATQGNIPPSLVSNATDDSAIMRKHAIGTVQQDGISFANKMPEYPLVITVYGEVAKHTLLLQHFQQSSLCRDPLLHHMGGKFKDKNAMGDEYLSYYARIVTRMSGATDGVVLERAHPAHGKEPEVSPSGLSSSTLVVTKISKKETFTKPWYGTGLIRDFSECDECGRGESCRHRRCFAQARVKLCGRRLEGTVNAWSESKPDSDVAIQIPTAYANTTVEMTVQSIGPGEFGCERVEWWMLHGDGDGCRHSHEKRSQPIELDLPPFQENTLLGRLRLRLREAYFPFFDGYGIEFTGMVNTRTWDPESVRGGPSTDIGQSMTLSLNAVDFFRVKVRYSVFGVIGGMASLFAFVIGFLADLCDPTPDYSQDTESCDGEAKKDADRKEGQTTAKKPKGMANADAKQEKQDWHQIVDSETGKPFYHNPMSGQTSWDRPKGAVVMELANNNGVSSMKFPGGKKDNATHGTKK